MHIVFATRIKRITFLMICAFCALTLYLIQLQIYQSSRFLQLSKRNFLRHKKIDCPRGSITDRHNMVLATDRPHYSLYWVGTGHQELTSVQENLITNLMILYPLEPDQLNELRKAEKRGLSLKLLNNIPYELLLQLTEQIPSSPNLSIHRTYKRHYPYDQLAAHVVGYLGSKDDLGKMGIERLYNKELTGQTGKIITVTNSVGQALKTHHVAQPAVGMTVRTTLDLSLQQLAEKLFPQEYEGCLLLMDADGGLEVAISRPSFAPEMFLDALTYEQWGQLQQSNRFINRSFTASYPPASLFKLVTLAAALETGIITPKTSWTCKGYTDFKGRRYHCNRRWGHGDISTKKAFAKSCNIPFYEIGVSLSIDTLADYAHRLGLGSKTGILFPEHEGLVPTTAWKRRVRKEPWWPGETLSAVIGQSALLVTPLQIACMISAVCTGYRVKPRILMNEPIQIEPLNINPSTLSFLQKCLQSVIKGGTASQLQGLEELTIYGKSGTAQVRSLSSKATSKADLCHGYFVAHFQYRDHAPRTLVIFLEHIGSSQHAIRLARQFIAQIALLEKKSSLATS